MKKLLFTLALLAALPMVGADDQKKFDPNNNNNPFNETPSDVIKEIFSYLGEKDWYPAFLVSKQFNKELSDTLEKKFGKEAFKLYKSTLLTRLQEKKALQNKVENKLKEISSYWLKSNRIQGFFDFWDQVVFEKTNFTFQEKISFVAHIFIQYAHQCSVEGWVKLGEKLLYSSLNAQSWFTKAISLSPEPCNWGWNRIV